jgi:hypothetical protein
MGVMRNVVGVNAKPLGVERTVVGVNAKPMGVVRNSSGINARSTGILYKLSGNDSKSMGFVYKSSGSDSRSMGFMYKSTCVPVDSTVVANKSVGFENSITGAAYKLPYSLQQLTYARYKPEGILLMEYRIDKLRLAT